MNFLDQVIGQEIDPNLKDDDWATPVHFAANFGQTTTLNWLLKHGGRITFDKKGKSPLDYAKESENLEVGFKIKFLNISQSNQIKIN